MPAKKSSGFTLIELMVTITIIAILAAVGAVVYSSAQKTGRISKRTQDLQAIRSAIELFKTTNGSYPNSQISGSPAAFVCADSLPTGNTLTPTFMSTVPRDPSQTSVGGTNCYQYIGNSIGATASSTDYKLRTNTSIPTSEMAYTDYNQQPSLLDPAHDPTSNGCTVDPYTATTNLGWAYYTTTTTACAY